MLVSRVIAWETSILRSLFTALPFHFCMERRHPWLPHLEEAGHEMPTIPTDVL